MTDVLREVLLPKLDGVRKQGGYWMARCPAHDDHQASLSITEGTEQPVLINCHAGCDRDVILDALGLTWDQLCAPRQNQPAAGEWTPWGPAVAVYDYVTETGELLFQVLRAQGKHFIQRRPDKAKKSGWDYKLGDTRRVLYRLPKIIAAAGRGEIIYVVEGEKDVHSAESVGMTATCNPHGAGKWLPGYSEFLRDAIVIIIADRDDAGYAHSRMVAKSLAKIAAAVEISEPAEGKDLSDHLAAGLGFADLKRIWQEGDAPPDLAPDLIDFIQVIDPPQVFVMDGLLELGDRMMLTGVEGHGKTTLMRQIGVCVAAGLDPFTSAVIHPRRVLHIDLENRERQSRREYRPLARRLAEVGHPLGRGWFRLICRPQGIDLSGADGRAWLLERVTAHEPELLLIGTLWHMSTADLNEEGNARVLVEAINDAINQAGCAAIIECHSPHGMAGRERPVRPAGSRLFTAWPDIGLGLVPDDKKNPDEPSRYRLRRWRGTRDRGQQWPNRLMPGITGGLPWVAVPDEEKLI